VLGLRFHEPPSKQEVDALLAPVARGGPATAAEREARVEETLELHTKSIRPSWLPATMQTVPWDRLRERESFDGLVAATVLVFATYVLTALYECVRGLEPGYYNSAALVGLLALAVWSLLQPMMRIGWDVADTTFSVAVGTVSTVISALVLAWTFNDSPANYLAVIGKAAGQAAEGVAAATAAAAATVDPTADIEEVTETVMNSAAATSAATVAAALSSGAWLDLGANLRLGLREALLRAGSLNGLTAPLQSFDTADADNSVFGYIIMIALVCGLFAALMVLPLLRFAEIYVEVENDAKSLATRGIPSQGPAIPATPALTVRAMNIVTGIWYTGPMLLVVLWLRPFLSQYVLHPRLVHCGVGAVARDCVLPRYNRDDPTAQIPQPEPYDAWFPLNETSWLRIRLWVVLIFSIVMFFTIRTLLAAHLRLNKQKQTNDLLTWARGVPGANTRVSAKKEKAAATAAAGPATSGLSAQDIQDLYAHLYMSCSNSLRNVMMVGLYFFSVPLVLAVLTLLIFRMGGLNAGCCDGLNTAFKAMGMESFFAWAKAGSASKTDMLQNLANVLGQSIMGEGFAVNVAFTRQSLVILTATFWRPVLSFVLWYFLVSMNVITFLGVVYWKFASPVARSRAKQEEEATPATGAAAAPSASAASGGKAKQK
jgi:hypothetical protein